MKLKKTTNKSSNTFRSISAIGILLVTFTQIPYVSAGEETVGAQDALQSAMMRNQVSINQQLSALQNKILNEDISRVSIMLEKETEQKMRVIELSNEKSRIEREEYMEMISTSLPPIGVKMNPLEGLADTNTGGY